MKFVLKVEDDFVNNIAPKLTDEQVAKLVLVEEGLRHCTTRDEARVIEAGASDACFQHQVDEKNDTVYVVVVNHFAAGRNDLL